MSNIFDEIKKSLDALIMQVQRLKALNDVLCGKSFSNSKFCSIDINEFIKKTNDGFIKNGENKKAILKS